MSYKGRSVERKMKNTAERRLRLLGILCKRKRETIERLSYELKVSKRTIRYDIEVLSLSFPIYTTTGPYGGVFIAGNYQFGMKYLTDTQCELLERLLEKLEGNDKEILHSILNTFRKPDIKGKN